MPRLLGLDDVDDIAQGLSSMKRAEVLAGGASDIPTVVFPGSDSRVALSMSVSDMDAFEAVTTSDAGAEAVKHDGVRPDTVEIYVEG